MNAQSNTRSWRHAPEWARRIGRGLDSAAIGLVVTSPVLVGGMWPPGQALWSALAVVLLVVVAALHAAVGGRWRWHALPLAVVGLAACTLLRATAVGAPLAGPFERAVFALWSEVDTVGTVAPGRAPLAALRLLGVAAIMQLWATRFRGRSGTRSTLLAVFGAVALSVALGVAHRALELGQVLAVFSPVDMASLRNPLAAPFVNENQAGALWMLGGVLAVGVGWLRPGQRSPWLLLGALLIVAAEVGLRSHAAGGAALCALLGFAALWALPPSTARAYGARLSGFVVATVVAFSVFAWFVLPGLALAGAHLAKAQAWKDTAVAALRRPFGYGPGAFPDAWGAVSTHVDALRATWVESAPLQLAVDHGWLAAGVVVALALRMLHRRYTSQRRGERDVRVVSAAVAIFVGCEAASGMALEAVGYAFPVAALVGLTVGRGRSRSELNAPRALVAVGAAAFIVLTLFTLPGLVASVRLGDEHAGRQLRPIELEHGMVSPEFRASIDDLSHQVPGDVVLLSYVADLALVDGDIEHAVAVVAHLTRYAPGRAVTWEIAGDVALADGDRGAACEAAVHLADRARDPARLTRLLRRIDADPRTWSACAPGEAALAAIYDGLRREDRIEEAFAVALRQLRETPDHAASLMAALEGAAAVDSPGLAAVYGTRLLEVEPSNVRAGVLTARTLAEEGRRADALALLDAAIDRSADVDLQLERLTLLAQWPDPPDPAAHRERFEAHYDALLPLVSGRLADAIRRLRIGAAFYASTEDWRSAENAYRAILRLRPDDERARDGLDRVIDARAPGGPP